MTFNDSFAVDLQFLTMLLLLKQTDTCNNQAMGFRESRQGMATDRESRVEANEKGEQRRSRRGFIQRRKRRPQERDIIGPVRAWLC